jgi:hypothetical protein
MGDRLVHRLSVIRSVCHYRRNLALDLPEQRWDLASVVSGIVGQRADDDLANIGLDGEMQLTPGPARSIVLLLITLALAEELRAGAMQYGRRGSRDDSPKDHIV